MLYPILFFGLSYAACVYASNNFEYKKAYWFFEFCHLFGGFLAAVFLSNFLTVPYIILSAAFLLGLIWEVCELIIDKSQKIKNFLLKFNIRQGPITLPDTLLDLFLDTLGALIWLKFFF